MNLAARMSSKMWSSVDGKSFWLIIASHNFNSLFSLTFVWAALCWIMTSMWRATVVGKSLILVRSFSWMEQMTVKRGKMCSKNSMTLARTFGESFAMDTHDMLPKNTFWTISMASLTNLPQKTSWQSVSNTISFWHSNFRMRHPFKFSTSVTRYISSSQLFSRWSVRGSTSALFSPFSTASEKSVENPKCARLLSGIYKNKMPLKGI